FLNAVVAVWNQDASNRTRPIRAYVQVVKIAAWLFAAILAISFLMDESPWALLGGLAGAMTVLLLVFKDSIMGLVASVQLSNYDLVRVGDWIEVPSYGADGDVLEVSLHTVKVQNWDKTITTLPTTALVTGGFKNWRGMSESGGRRIKRSISLDMRSVQFVDSDMLARLKQIDYIQDYLNRKTQEVGAWNKEQVVNESSLVNGRRLTNLGTFRAYIEFYLQNHPSISKEMTFLVRQLPPNEKGVPIQLYVFSTEKRWVQYEAIISDVFDHIIAVIPEFGLRVFQNPTGADFHRLISK
ncbi:MAG: mechanosensitive ion channel, partial [Planctomycetes bacterium]|nr:mechanosensitive ion channel [Planctomycetota bacterium]